MARVRAVVAAGRSLARPEPSFLAELVASTGLSREGVALALDAHLETEPADEELASLVRAVDPAPEVFVLLSANAFVGALRALACAVAASPRVTVKPSRRDPCFARALVRAVGDAEVTVVDEVDLARLPPCALHVYGRDRTLEAVRAQVPGHVRVAAHGAGMGLVVLDARVGEASAEHAEALARDIVPFDQRGCLSPRLAIVVGGWHDGERFARALAEALARWAVDVPVGVLEVEERVAQRELRELAMLTGTAFGAEAACVALLPPSAVLAPSPVGRAMVVTVVADEGERDRMVARFRDHVTTIAVARGERAPWMPHGARVTRPGAMQRPPLDGPVDRRRVVDGDRSAR